MEWPVKKLGNHDWGWAVILDLRPMEKFNGPYYSELLYDSPQYSLYDILTLDSTVHLQLFDFVAKKDP